MSKIKTKYKCALELTNSLLGGKWKLRILWHIVYGDNRFSYLKKALPEISEKVLYTNLRELEEHEIIYKTVVQEEKKIAVFYYLREEYSSLKPVINSICTFTRDYAKLNEIEIG